MPVAGAEDLSPVRVDDLAAEQPSEALTNVGQLRSVPAQVYLRGCPLRLVGTVTLVDTNRHLVVLQDATGAVAVNLDTNVISLAPGQVIAIEAAKTSPYLVSLPDYPYRPSGRDIRALFEAPSNWGDYHLTRMRGYLHPPVTGEYTFWIASDNSSELWLSPGQDPAKIRRIAFVAQGTWVDSREWSRYASQRSESIFLRADQTYYIEALQEQLLEADYLAVAWQGPGLTQSVIDGRYLSPWVEDGDRRLSGRTNGILWESWTNYSAGSLAGVAGPRSFESALSAKHVRVTVLGRGNLPEPRRIRLDQPLSPEDNYCWVEAEGVVGFVGTDGHSANVELAGGEGWTQLRVSKWDGNLPHRAQNWLRAQGVCEGVRSARGLLMPGFIWVPSEHNLSFIELTNPRSASLATVPPYHLTQASSYAALGGYYFTRGVVTFHDKVLGKDSLFIQDDTAGILVSQTDPRLGSQLQVGQLVDLVGQLSSGKYAPILQPVTMAVAGWRRLPEPEAQAGELSLPASRDGRWTEVEGVVRWINPNGTMVMMARRGPVCVWVGQTPPNVLTRYVDATSRVRGVMSLSTHETPVLLVPSPRFVELEQEPPVDPFLIPSRLVGSLGASETDLQWVHRVKVNGVVTFRDEKSLFLEDASGGARVQTLDLPSAQIGDSVEVVGFPEAGHSLPVLTEALVHRSGAGKPVRPAEVDLADVVAGKHNGTVVRLRATVLAQKKRETSQVLELQDGQRVFQATLATSQGYLPSLAAGSLVEITGVCEVELATLPAPGQPSRETPSAASVQIFLRRPSDVLLLHGPPWWTWKRAVTLVGMLLTVLMGTLLWIHFLRRRLERQQAAQLAFSRQILEGQESERRRIAANLHDGLGQNLLVIKNQARLAMQPTTDESVLHQRLEAISGVASQAIEEVRQITHDLRPYQLDRLGLTLAIRAIINRVSENCPILFASHVDDIDGLFNNESEIHVYRIVQEGLNNVVKHSAATEAAVVIKRQAQLVSLSIRDNGRGFNTSLENAAGLNEAGFGLSGISERIRILGGTLTLDSRLGQGTNLTCEIPPTNSRHET